MLELDQRRECAALAVSTAARWSLMSITFDGEGIWLTREFMKMNWNTMGLSTQTMRSQYSAFVEVFRLWVEKEITTGNIVLVYCKCEPTPWRSSKNLLRMYSKKQVQHRIEQDAGPSKCWCFRIFRYIRDRCLSCGTCRTGRRSRTCLRQRRRC